MKKSYFLVLILLIILWFNFPLFGQASPWPMFMHDQRHTGRSSLVGYEAAKLKWQYPGQEPYIAFYSSPCLGDDGTIYVGGYDGNFYAFTDMDTFVELRQFKWHSTYKRCSSVG